MKDRADIKLYNSDCMEALGNMEDKSVDLIITDPPYGMNFVSNYRKKSISLSKMTMSFLYGYLTSLTE